VSHRPEPEDEFHGTVALGQPTAGRRPDLDSGSDRQGLLIEVADQAGVAVLNAEVLPQNQHMLHLLGDSGIPVTTHTIPGVVLVELPTSLSPRAGALRTPRAALEQAPVGEGM
jgi:hypothetical protein